MNFFQALYLIAGILFIVPAIKRYRKHAEKREDRLSRETWAIGMYEGTSPLLLAPAKQIENPVLTADDVTDVRARFVADPFMIKHEKEYFLFFEVLNEKRNTGEIGYASSEDGWRWHYRKIVLREPFHLSYPYVFSWENSIFMVPECRKSGGIQLYRATNFPFEWKKVATLVKGSKSSRAPLVDPSIVNYRSRWYLFSYALKTKSLHLFHSDSLTGPWKEHPKSPLVSGSPSYSRPGGRIIIDNGNLYRFSQDEIPNYGTRVWAFQITELSEYGYAEKPAFQEPVVEPGNGIWNRDGMHTVDAHRQEDGKWIVYVDGFTVNLPKS
ncbi:MAG: hypothetical protein HGB36_10850 [Chlorobiaceae bacterium]|nr:hypothetical protein [Chlorobiaceae bacterium]